MGCRHSMGYSPFFLPSTKCHSLFRPWLGIEDFLLLFSIVLVQTLHARYDFNRVGYLKRTLCKFRVHCYGNSLNTRTLAKLHPVWLFVTAKETRNASLRHAFHFTCKKTETSTNTMLNLLTQILKTESALHPILL